MTTLCRPLAAAHVGEEASGGLRSLPSRQELAVDAGRDVRDCRRQPGEQGQRESVGGRCLAQAVVACQQISQGRFQVSEDAVALHYPALDPGPVLLIGQLT